MISVKLTGQKQFINALQGYKTRKIKGAEEELDKTLFRAERTAKRLAPVGTPESVGKESYSGGNLRASITRFRNGLEGGLFTRVPYAPYVEFGTGTLVSVPSELKAIAEQFRGKGIRQVNLPAQPFMFPAIVKERKRFVKGLDQMLGNEEI